MRYSAVARSSSRTRIIAYRRHLRYALDDSAARRAEYYKGGGGQAAEKHPARAVMARLSPGTYYKISST